MFQWVEGVTAEQIAGSEAALAALPEQIPELRSYGFGADAGMADGNFDFAVVADFDGVDGYEVYRDHPAHREVIKEHLAPIIATRVAVQHEVAGTAD